jgi:hypothetical protein
LFDEATRWGVRPQRSAQIINDLLERLPDALTAAADSIAIVPGALIELVVGRVAAARTELPATTRR